VKRDILELLYVALGILAVLAGGQIMWLQHRRGRSAGPGDTFTASAYALLALFLLIFGVGLIVRAAG
jgi:hypothetical protein